MRSMRRSQSSLGYLRPGNVVRHVVVVLLAVVSMLPAGRASAQTCLGTASFGAGLVRAGATFASLDGAKAYGGTVAVGAATGPFADLALARADYDDANASATAFSIGVGYAIEVVPGGRVQFCPRIAHVQQHGPDIDTGFGTLSTKLRASEIGASLGGLLSVSPRFDVVPFAGAAYVATRATLDFEQGGPESTTEDSGQLQLGAGLVLDHRLTLQPAVLIPLGSEGGRSVFQLMLAWNFGPTHK
jgi:hypothetical protein